jgi:RNA polymerase primary sigma factor
MARMKKSAVSEAALDDSLSDELVELDSLNDELAADLTSDMTTDMTADLTSDLAAEAASELEGDDFEGDGLAHIIGPGRKKRVEPASEESLQAYLHNIGKTDLIKANEEIELGRAIHAGSDEALSKLVVSNLRLVVSIAKRFRNQGLDMEDMIQEGNLGLIHAAKKFDPTMGNRFSTYATWWIRQAVMRGIANKGRVIRIPVHVRAQLGRIRRFAKDFRQANGRFPTEVELAGGLEISTDEISRLVNSAGNIASLDEVVPGSEKDTLGSFIEDQFTAKPERGAEQAMLRRGIDRLTQFLSPLEKTAISYLYGLEGDGVYDSKMVAAKLGIDVPELRRIQKRSLKKLRRHLYNKSINDFIS